MNALGSFLEIVLVAVGVLLLLWILWLSSTGRS